MGVKALLGAAVCVALATSVVGCEAPMLAKDGTLVFPESGARGASVLTANGLEFRDREDIPPRIVRRTIEEPWRAPVGFILPRSGRFTETSRPTVVATTGLAFALRPSDSRVPSWGGEVLVRVDVIAPAALGTARLGERLVIIIDGGGIDSLVLAGAALDQLGAYDHIAVVDTTDSRIVLPPIPANHRSLAEAAIERRLRGTTRKHGDLAAAFQSARNIVGAAPGSRVLVLTDGASAPTVAAEHEAQAFARAGAVVSAIATRPGLDVSLVTPLVAGGGVAYADDDVASRTAAVKVAVPAAGMTVFKDVVLTFAGNPAPSHVLETSGGGVRWRLDAGELLLGDVIAGEARTEVVRVTVPPYVPGHKFTFEVTARAHDVSTGGERTFTAEIPCVYDDDIERIADSRYGDVIAYASALATLKRLDAAFVGDDVDRAGGIAMIARLHARSMTYLAHDTQDRAITEQAEVLNALLSVQP
ncbi:hypothetical protein BH09MYX1_BH09MYX1_67440 [soil metagenome]